MLPALHFFPLESINNEKNPQCQIWMEELIRVTLWSIRWRFWFFKEKASLFLWPLTLCCEAARLTDMGYFYHFTRGVTEFSGNVHTCSKQCVILHVAISARKKTNTASMWFHIINILLQTNKCAKLFSDKNQGAIMKYLCKITGLSKWKSLNCHPHWQLCMLPSTSPWQIVSWLTYRECICIN